MRWTFSRACLHVEVGLLHAYLYDDEVVHYFGRWRSRHQTRTCSTTILVFFFKFSLECLRVCFGTTKWQCCPSVGITLSPPFPYPVCVLITGEGCVEHMHINRDAGKYRTFVIFPWQIERFLWQIMLSWGWQFTLASTTNSGENWTWQICHAFRRKLPSSRQHNMPKKVFLPWLKIWRQWFKILL